MATQFINYTAENIGTTTYHMIDGTATTSDGETENGGEARD